MLRDITKKIDRYFPALHKIGFEAILKDMDARITSAAAGELAPGSVSAAEVASDSVTTIKITNLNVTTAKIADNAVTLGKLAAGITPTVVPKLSGSVTWTGAGASLASTIAGVLTTDIVIASITIAPTQAAYLASVKPTAADTITFVLSAANTANNAVISYVVYRAAA